jgi:hypothetical protein
MKELIEAGTEQAPQAGTSGYAARLPAPALIAVSASRTRRWAWCWR